MIQPSRKVRLFQVLFVLLALVIVAGIGAGFYFAWQATLVGLLLLVLAGLGAFAGYRNYYVSLDDDEHEFMLNASER